MKKTRVIGKENSGWVPSEFRYQAMKYNRCGRSGLTLPAVSLGLWHNFGGVDPFETMRRMVRLAFDLGITHFDLANNYGPPPGSAEENFGRLLREEFAAHRDELVISTKAGHRMWPGPYGEWGSRKYLLSSLDQSLKRMGLDYVDIFYHHRPDPDTPVEESMAALDQAVRQGKALYAGISSYQPDQTRAAARILRALGTPCLIHQPVYNLFNRRVEDGLVQVLAEEGIGCIVFSPLAQGLLTDRYLNGIAPGTRASKPHGALKPERVSPETMVKVRALNEIARRRGQSLAQMAIAWVLRLPAVTSALVGASRPEQVGDCVNALRGPALSQDELREIDGALAAE
jgi:L-glyceraldehyde 3-phosphate reductase